MNRKIEIGQARFEQLNRAPGIDCPDHAIILQRPNHFQATRIEHRIAGVRDEGAVKIGAEETNGGGHPAAIYGADLNQCQYDRSKDSPFR